MNPIDIIFIFVFFFFAVLILIFIIKYKAIASFFFPYNWVEIVMIESDNHISQWKQRKNSDLRFTFNKGYYNLFQSADKIDFDNGKRKVSGGVSIYRQGRLPLFFYVEGNENPVDLKNLEITGNPQLNKQLLKIDISQMFIDDSDGFSAFLKKYGIIILIFGIIVIVILIITKGSGSEQVADTVQQASRGVGGV